MTSGCARSVPEAIAGDRDCVTSISIACAPCRASVRVHVCVSAHECARMHTHTHSALLKCHLPHTVSSSALQPDSPLLFPQNSQKTWQVPLFWNFLCSLDQNYFCK